MATTSLFGVTIIVIISFIFVATTAETTNDLIVELIKPHGKIRGHVLESAKKKPYYAFQEIPYATPPIGENRFRSPKPHDGWDGILDTTKNTKICYQFHSFIPSDLDVGDNQLTMSEDCLFLNVYTPVKPGSTEALPVFFFIHGGAFAVGDGTFNSYDPKYLMDGGVIVVTINYRLGPFGFLAIRDSGNSGNMALKDQQMALIWTYDNIHAFGGDPKNIVVAGQSSGAFAAGYNLLNQQNKGLISGIIQQSGSPLSAAAHMVRSQDYALTLGRSINESIASYNVDHLLETLRNASADEIQTAAREVLNPHSLGFMSNPSWGPVVESEDVDDAFITSPMHDAFHNGNFNRVPILMGFNSEEALFFLPPNSEAELRENAARIDANVSLLVGELMHVKNRTVVGTELRKAYTPKTFSEDLGALVKYTSDVVFAHPSIRQAELTSKYVPVYLYQLSVGGNEDSIFPGIPHGSDLRYFWNMKTTFDRSPIDESVREYLLELWWNFLKFKNPTPRKEAMLENIEWLPVSPEDIKYLNIDSEMSMQTDPSNYKAVKEIYEKYVKPPFYIF